MKLLKILTENVVTPIDKKMVSVLQRMKVDPADVGEIWSTLTDPLSIYDVELKTKITFLYSQYCHYNEEIRKEIDIVCDNLDDVDFDKMESVDNVDNEQLALSRFLDVYPFVLGLTRYSQYGLNVYEFDGDTYAVGDEDEVQDAMYQVSEMFIDDDMEYLETWWLDEFLSINDYAVDQFCEEEADNRLDNMSEEEMMEEVGMDPDEKQEEIDDFESRKEEKEEQLVEMEGELEELENLRDEVEEEYGDESDEYYEVYQEHANKEEGVDELSDDIESLGGDIVESQQELSNMPQEAKNELYDSYKEDCKSEVESNGVNYFTDNLGMSRADAIDYYFDFDREGAIQSLADERDRGEALSGNDGVENEEEYDGVVYYTYLQG